MWGEQGNVHWWLGVVFRGVPVAEVHPGPLGKVLNGSEPTLVVFSGVQLGATVAMPIPASSERVWAVRGSVETVLKGPGLFTGACGGLRSQ